MNWGKKAATITKTASTWFVSDKITPVATWQTKNANCLQFGSHFDIPFASYVYYVLTRSLLLEHIAFPALILVWISDMLFFIRQILEKSTVSPKWMSKKNLIDACGTWISFGDGPHLFIYRFDLPQHTWMSRIAFVFVIGINFDGVFLSFDGFFKGFVRGFVFFRIYVGFFFRRL